MASISRSSANLLEESRSRLPCNRGSIACSHIGFLFPLPHSQPFQERWKFFTVIFILYSCSNSRHWSPPWYLARHHWTTGLYDLWAAPSHPLKQEALFCSWCHPLLSCSLPLFLLCRSRFWWLWQWSHLQVPLWPIWTGCTWFQDPGEEPYLYCICSHLFLVVWSLTKSSTSWELAKQMS